MGKVITELATAGGGGGAQSRTKKLSHLGRFMQTLNRGERSKGAEEERYFV